jgi:GH18 family chitinase
MFAFLNPDLDGNLSIGDKDLEPIIEKAKSVNPDMQLFISIAGGGSNPVVDAAYDKWLKPENRTEFIHLLMNYVRDHQLDGLDVDLEWGDVNEYYSPFVLELADSLHNAELLISAALPCTYRYADVSDEALAVYDFINIMAYDKHGPWNPNNPGHHSPYSFAVEGIDFWKGHGVSGDRLTLGVPFYGYDFTNRADVNAFTFWNILKEDAGNAWIDQRGEKYWNGIPTIRDKTELAMDEVSGIMIWEVGQDAFAPDEDYSLLRAIDNTINGVPTALEPPLLASHTISISPNPYRDVLNLNYQGETADAEIQLVDLQGRILFQEQQVIQDGGTTWNLAHLPAGLYLCNVKIDGTSIVKKVMKI